MLEVINYGNITNYNNTPSQSWWSGGYTNRYRSSLGYDRRALYDYSRISYNPYERTYTSISDVYNIKELLSAAYKAVRDIVVILDLPFVVKICLSKETFIRKHPDNTRYMFLATKILEEKSLTDSEKIDALCGNGVHEAAHIKYSEVRVFLSFKNLVASKYNPEECSFIHLLFNILEDERVEDKLLRDRPGYLTYITNKKNIEYEYHLSKYHKGVYSELDKIYDIISFIRYRDKWAEDESSKNLVDENIFIEIKNLLGPLYESDTINTKGVCELSIKLFEIIKYFILDPSSLIPDGIISRIVTDMFWYTPLISGFDDECTSSANSYIPRNTIDCTRDDELLLYENLAEGSIDCQEEGHYFIYVESSPGDRERYNDIKDSISKYIPSIRNLLVAQTKNYDYNIYGCRHGLLDTTKLAEAYQGVPQVYIRRGHVQTNNQAICILIDESGSMDGSKMEAAREAAILLNESFSGIPGLDLFIYGHTADIEPVTERTSCGAVDISVYKEPSKKCEKDGINLYRIYSKCENKDGVAILDVAKRVRKFTTDHCLMFVISDGEPSAMNYRNGYAIEHTKSAIKTVESTYDMDIIGICIDNVYCAKNLYSKYIDLNYDLENFPKDLGKIIKESILKSRKVITS